MRLGEDDKKMFEFARLVEGVSPRSGWEVMRVYLSERLKYVRMLFHEAALGDASLGDLAHIAGLTEIRSKLREAIGHLKARAGEYVLLTNASAENFFRREVVLNRIESGRPFLSEHD